MGNSFSRRNAVLVQTEGQVYQSGDVVEGVVCLNLVDPLDLSSIQIQLQGLERTDFQTESFGTERTDLGRLDQFLSVCRTLPGSDKRLEPGQYEWSFVVALPEDARSTFRLLHGVEGKKSFRCAKIEYLLNVYVCKRDKSGKHAFVLRDSRPLVVLKRAELGPAQSIEQCAEEAVTRWCCIREGTIKARAFAHRCTYLPGEEVHVMIEVDNQSPHRIEAVQLSLRHMNWLRMTTQLADHERGHIEHFYRVPASAAVEPFSAQNRTMSMTLPGELQPSYTGSCITSKFFIVVRLCMALSTGDVQLQLPITILPPRLDPEDTTTKPERPDFWRPQQGGAPVAMRAPGSIATKLEDRLKDIDWADKFKGVLENLVG